MPVEKRKGKPTTDQNSAILYPPYGFEAENYADSKICDRQTDIQKRSVNIPIHHKLTL